MEQRSNKALAADGGLTLVIYSPIIFGLGPSGVGKSHILELLAPKIGFFLLDLDTRRPFGRNGLRNQWHTFSTELNPQPLLKVLHDRITTENTVGIILLFPSTRILKPEHVAAATAVGIRTILLWGPEDLCRKAALERNDGRVTTEAQYDKANRRVLRLMLPLNTTKYALTHFVMDRDCRRRS